MPPLDELGAAIETTEASRRAAQAELEQARAAARELATASTRAHTQLESVEQRLSETREALASIPESDAALDASLREARARLERVEADLRAARAELDALGGPLVAQELERARGALDKNRAALDEAKRQVTTLEARIDAADRGRTERLAEVEAELHALEQESARLDAEADALALLKDLLEDAHARAQHRFTAPVLREIEDYVKAVMPGARLELDADLGLAGRVRGPDKEPLDQLSGGTREQIAILVRVGLAKVLARQGHTMPLILDDTMGWTDDHRFDRMALILESVAKDLQLVVLSCQTRRFRRMRVEREVDLAARLAPPGNATGSGALPMETAQHPGTTQAPA
jgi:uncharacterized protein YhaN